MKCITLRTGSCVALALTCSLAALPAIAQSQPPPAETPRETIVVTGTRLDGRSLTDTPVPVLSIGKDELDATPGTIADALRILPQVVPGGGPAVAGGSDGGQNFLDLRALGVDRTLVLLEGRRFIPAGPNGFTDVNLIPQMLVSQVNIVTGGASAAYGADAVAGVVDFKLDTRFSGLRLHGYSGISQRGDNAETKLAAAAGLAALDGRLHLVVSGEHYDNDGVRGDARSFRRTAGGQIRNPGDGPTLVRAADVRTPYTDGGLVVIGRGGSAQANAQISGLKFERGGGTSAYDYGINSTTRLSTGGNQDGGDGFRASTGQDVIRPQERDLLFAHATFAASDALEFDFEASRARTVSIFSNSPNRERVTIRRNNPFLARAAPELVERMTALGVTGFTLNRMILERGDTLSRFRFNAGHELVGARLSLFGLEWRAAFQHARNSVLNTVSNNLIPDNYELAIDAAIGPDGTPVCAALLDPDPAVREAARGCVAFNPFGAGAPSAAALDYVTGTAVASGVTSMNSFDADVTGNIDGLTRDPIAFAAGVSWREIKSTLEADPRSRDGGFRVRNQQNFAGRSWVREAFAEVQVPLLGERALAESLDVNLAGRIVDYEHSGTAWTWKAGVNWHPTRSLRLRATRSRDIRAPNLEELFATGRQGKETVYDSLTDRTYIDIAERMIGNLSLEPEKADTWVAGLDFMPSPNLDLSLDYWAIDISDAISGITADQLVEQCNLSGQTLSICSWITRDPVTLAILETRVSPVNLNSQRARGVDFELNLRAGDAWLGAREGDRADLRILASYAIKNEARSPLITNPVDDVGNLLAQTSPAGSRNSSLPRLRSNASLDLRKGPWGLFLLGRYIHSLTWDKTRVLGIDTDFNHVPAQFYLDAEISAHPRIGDREVEVYLNVQNLLDHQPPYSPIPGNSTPLPTQPVLYDQVGRMFRLGVKLEL